MKKQNSYLNNFKTSILLTVLFALGVQLNAQVSVWHFDSNADAAPTTYNATTVGSPTYTAGKVGDALTLNGTTQYATAPYVVNPTSAFTATAWVKYTGSRTTPLLYGPTILQQGDASGTGRGWLILDKNTLQFGAYLQGVSTNGTTVAQNNTWYMVSITYSGSGTKQLKVYVNGVLEKTATITPESSVGALYIGSHKAAGTNLWTGSIDEMAIYNTELTASELLTIYNNTLTTINKPSPASNKMYAADKKIVVEGVVSEVSVLDLNGRNIQSSKIAGTFTSKTLNNGLYLIKVDGATRKLAIQ